MQVYWHILGLVGGGLLGGEEGGQRAVLESWR